MPQNSQDTRHHHRSMNYFDVDDASDSEMLSSRPKNTTGHLPKARRLDAHRYKLSILNDGLEGHLTYYAHNAYDKQRKREALWLAWKQLIKGAKGTFKHNTTCPSCQETWGTGPHTEPDGLRGGRRNLINDMRDMDLEEGFRQEKMWKFEERWLELEEMYWNHKRNKDCWALPWPEKDSETF
jgi:hypothetical protein